MDQQKMLAIATSSSLSKIPKLAYRGRIFDYLYAHKVGNRLPRGKSFRYFRGMENCSTWNREVYDFNFKIHTKKYEGRISPLLLSQVTFLSYLARHYKVPLAAESVFDVIEMLEGHPSNSTTTLLKHKIPFEPYGPYAGYEHHHVNVLPDADLEMLAKGSNQKRIVAHTTLSPNISIDFGKVNAEIKSKKPCKEGRMTGFWLISRSVGGENLYMGLFPHSRGVIKNLKSQMHSDDRSICLQLRESERLLKLKRQKLK